MCLCIFHFLLLVLPALKEPHTHAYEHLNLRLMPWLQLSHDPVNSGSLTFLYVCVSNLQGKQVLGLFKQGIKDRDSKTVDLKEPKT